MSCYRCHDLAHTHVYVLIPQFCSPIARDVSFLQDMMLLFAFILFFLCRCVFAVWCGGLSNRSKGMKTYHHSESCIGYISSSTSHIQRVSSRLCDPFCHGQSDHQSALVLREQEGEQENNKRAKEERKGEKRQAVGRETGQRSSRCIAISSIKAR